MLNATPVKLRNGAWGARVAGPAAVGDAVTITTKAGKSWEARVARVVWSGEGVTLCATESGSRPASGRRSYSRSYSRPRGRCEDAPCCGCCDVYGNAL